MRERGELAREELLFLRTRRAGLLALRLATFLVVRRLAAFLTVLRLWAFLMVRRRLGELAFRVAAFRVAAFRVAVFRVAVFRVAVFRVVVFLEVFLRLCAEVLDDERRFPPAFLRVGISVHSFRGLPRVFKII